MAQINKNTDLKPLNEYFLGKGTIEIFPLKPLDISKEGNLLSELPIHWHRDPSDSKNKFNAECSLHVCPICEILRPPKTKWQKIKEKIKSWFTKK